MTPTARADHASGARCGDQRIQTVPAILRANDLLRGLGLDACPNKVPTAEVKNRCSARAIKLSRPAWHSEPFREARLAGLRNAQGHLDKRQNRTDSSRKEAFLLSHSVARPSA